MAHPQDHKNGSNKVVEWLCDCGKTAMLPIVRVANGRAKSCGRCNEVDSSTMEQSKFGKLRMKFPESVLRASSKRVWWVCDCGKDTQATMVEVTRGHRTSCGKCNTMPAEFWANTKFGRLRLRFATELALRSNKKLEWQCDCGGVFQAVVQNVTRGRTVCCGKCRSGVDSWFAKHREQLRAMKPPISPSDLPAGPFAILDKVTRTSSPVLALCGACGKEYAPRWDHIRAGAALTCGCSTNRTSSGQLELAEFVRSLGLDVRLEHKIGKLSYDMFVETHAIVLEFQGTKWHSLPGSKQRDWTKYQNAVQRGLGVMAVYEDEWLLRQQQIKQIVRNRLMKSRPAHAWRASEAKIERVPNSSANAFYESFHYLGRCRSAASYGAFANGKMVACCSFAKPTRQSAHPWELIRMASDPDYKVHGVWSRLLRRFVADARPASIVSFSDNRLFTGRVYDRLGFKNDGCVPQSYYWTKAGKRYNKSGLRKRGQERESTHTETELRESQGYSKIWDLGKKRWVWNP
jgi:GNAT superfamily N-acetyltransferase/predicted SprT family Zn-dependent metalloprotease